MTSPSRGGDDWSVTAETSNPQTVERYEELSLIGVGSKKKTMNRMYDPCKLKFPFCGPFVCRYIPLINEIFQEESPSRIKEAGRSAERMRLSMISRSHLEWKKPCNPLRLPLTATCLQGCFPDTFPVLAGKKLTQNFIQSAKAFD